MIASEYVALLLYTLVPQTKALSQAGLSKYVFIDWSKWGSLKTPNYADI